VVKLPKNSGPTSVIVPEKFQVLTNVVPEICTYYLGPNSDASNNRTAFWKKVNCGPIPGRPLMTHWLIIRYIVIRVAHLCGLTTYQLQASASHAECLYSINLFVMRRIRLIVLVFWQGWFRSWVVTRGAV